MEKHKILRVALLSRDTHQMFSEVLVPLGHDLFFEQAPVARLFSGHEGAMDQAKALFLFDEGDQFYRLRFAEGMCGIFETEKGQKRPDVLKYGFGVPKVGDHWLLPLKPDFKGKLEIDSRFYVLFQFVESPKQKNRRRRVN